AVATALSVGVASAANLGAVTDGKLGSGAATVTRCDDAVTVSFTTTNGTLDSVTVNGISADCAQATLSYTLVGSTGAKVGNSNGTATVPTGGGSVSLAVATTKPAASTVATVQVLMVGP
ncbi:MAG TPA: hypothetical protein VFD53_05700, partial [Ilumatobacter sp.]|nr:hypothetical protein [Ilumatobacter sp.]